MFHHNNSDGRARLHDVDSKVVDDVHMAHEDGRSRTEGDA